MIRVTLVIGDLSMSSIFHVIYAKSSYKLLLRWPCLHKHGIVAESFFTKVEKGRYMAMSSHSLRPSHFADARFFEEDDAPTKTMPRGAKNFVQAPKEDIPKHHLEKKESEQGGASSYIKQIDMKVTTSIESTPIILRDIRKA